MIYRILAHRDLLKGQRCNSTGILKTTNCLGSFFLVLPSPIPTSGKFLIPKHSFLFVYDLVNNMGSHAFATMYGESASKKTIMAKIMLIDLSLLGLSGLIHVLLQTLGFLAHQYPFLWVTATTSMNNSSNNNTSRRITQLP